jgi:hypothetical protein
MGKLGKAESNQEPTVSGEIHANIFYTAPGGSGAIGVSEEVAISEQQVRGVAGGLESELFHSTRAKSLFTRPKKEVKERVLGKITGMPEGGASVVGERGQGMSTTRGNEDRNSTDAEATLSAGHVVLKKERETKNLVSDLSQDVANSPTAVLEQVRNPFTIGSYLCGACLQLLESQKSSRGNADRLAD